MFGGIAVCVLNLPIIWLFGFGGLDVLIFGCGIAGIAAGQTETKGIYILSMVLSILSILAFCVVTLGLLLGSAVCNAVNDLNGCGVCGDATKCGGAGE